MNDEDNVNLASGIAAFEAKEFRRAWQLLQPLADTGVADAQYRCAIMKQNGLGVIARPAEAAAMMADAAAQGYGLAQHSLGIMYLFGEGVEKNGDEAVRLLELAGDAGLQGAWTTLGMMFTDGEGVEQNIERGHDYYRRAGFDPTEFT